MLHTCNNIIVLIKSPYRHPGWQPDSCSCYGRWVPPGPHFVIKTCAHTHKVKTIYVSALIIAVFSLFLCWELRLPSGTNVIDALARTSHTACSQSSSTRSLTLTNATHLMLHRDKSFSRRFHDSCRGVFCWYSRTLINTPFCVIYCLNNEDVGLKYMWYRSYIMQ